MSTNKVSRRQVQTKNGYTIYELVWYEYDKVDNKSVERVMYEAVFNDDKSSVLKLSFTVLICMIVLQVLYILSTNAYSVDNVGFLILIVVMAATSKKLYISDKNSRVRKSTLAETMDGV